MKLELKGYLIQVGEPFEVGKKGTIIQNCVLHKPAYRDEFGDKKGQDDYFPLKALAFPGQNNSIIDRVNLKEAEGKRVTCTCFLNGRKLDLDEVTYINELRLYDIEIHEAKKPKEEKPSKPKYKEPEWDDTVNKDELKSFDDPHTPTRKDSAL